MLALISFSRDAGDVPTALDYAEIQQLAARYGHAPQSAADILRQLGEFRAAVVDNRAIHRPPIEARDE